MGFPQKVATIMGPVRKPMEFLNGWKLEDGGMESEYFFSIQLDDF